MPLFLCCFHSDLEECTVFTQQWVTSQRFICKKRQDSKDAQRQAVLTLPAEAVPPKATAFPLHPKSSTSQLFLSGQIQSAPSWLSWPAPTLQRGQTKVCHRTSVRQGSTAKLSIPVKYTFQIQIVHTHTLHFLNVILQNLRKQFKECPRPTQVPCMGLPLLQKCGTSVPLGGLGGW